MCLPLRAGLIWTKNKAGMVCLFSWLISILLTSPMLAIANYKDDPKPTCSTNVDPPWTKGFFLSIISVFFWLPLFVLVFLYAIIARHLTANVAVTKHAGSTTAAHIQQQGQHPPQAQGQSEPAAVTRGRRQIVIMLGTVVLFFFACLLPFKVINRSMIQSLTEFLKQESTKIKLSYVL